MTVSVSAEADLKTLWVIRDRMRFVGHLDGHDTHLAIIDVPVGSGTPPHRHASPELFRVNSGEITFALFDAVPPRAVVAGPGMVVSIAPWVAHNYANSGSTTAAMEVMVDGGMVAFFEDVGSTDEPPAGPPSEEEIKNVMAACARHGIEILAPADA